MTAATHCPLNGAVNASLSAATWTPGDGADAVLSSVSNGEVADLRIPVSSEAAARQLLLAIGDKLREIEDSLPVKALELAGTSAELWELQLASSARLYESSVKEVLDEARSVNKYTPEMSKKLVAARGKLLDSLHDISRINTAFRIDTKDPRLVTLRRQAALDKNILSLEKVSLSSQASASKKLIKQTLRAPLPQLSEPILLDHRLAKTLGRMNTFLVTIQVTSDAALLLSAKSEDEQKNAFAKLLAGLAGIAVTSGATSLCVLLGPAALSCGLSVFSAGVYLGDSIEKSIQIWLYKKFASDATPVSVKAVLP
jgi:hypothetical protein